MLYKILASQVNLICYFFMILAFMKNGGLLYMVYPLIIFGYALMLERDPGKYFWYFIVVYT